MFGMPSWIVPEKRLKSRNFSFGAVSAARFTIGRNPQGVTAICTCRKYCRVPGCCIRSGNSSTGLGEGLDWNPLATCEEFGVLLLVYRSHPPSTVEFVGFLRLKTWGCAFYC